MKKYGYSFHLWAVNVCVHVLEIKSNGISKFFEYDVWNISTYLLKESECIELRTFCSIAKTSMPVWMSWMKYLYSWVSWDLNKSEDYTIFLTLHVFLTGSLKRFYGKVWCQPPHTSTPEFHLFYHLTSCHQNIPDVSTNVFGILSPEKRFRPLCLKTFLVDSKNNLSLFSRL